jgi:hypothetical protein
MKRENQCTRRKPRSSAALSTTNPTRNDLRSNHHLPEKTSKTNLLRHIMAHVITWSYRALRRRGWRSFFALNIPSFESRHRNMIGRLKLFSSALGVWLRHCLQARRSRVRFHLGSLGLLIDLILPGAIWHSGRLSLEKPIYHEYLPSGKGGDFVGMTILQASCDDCLEILRASISFSPKGLGLTVSTTLLYKSTFQTFDAEKKFNESSVKITGQSLGHMTSMKRC